MNFVKPSFLTWFVFVVSLIAFLFVSVGFFNVYGFVDDGLVSPDYYSVEFDDSEGVVLNVSHDFNGSCLRVRRYHGGSMQPFIGGGGLNVVDVCFPRGLLQVGDVIVFWKNETNTLQHRVLKIDVENKIIVTKGDNNCCSDEPISFSQVHSKVIGVLNIIIE